MGTRKRILKGQLVRSTNEVRNDLAQSLTIQHIYNPISFKKIARVVVQPTIELVFDFNNRKIIEVCR